MAGSQVEVERTFRLPDPDSPLPDLAGVPGVAQVRVLADEDLDATYYDTSDLRLATAGLTLRRRTGGRDAGWTLKLPVGESARQEVSRPLSQRSTSVPPDLRALVTAAVSGRRLMQVVRIRTHRAVRQLLDPDGRILAEVADDAVTGEVLLAPRQSTQWREIEVELVAGDRALLDAVERHLEDAGASRAKRGSKLATTLGDRLPEPPPKRLPKKATAADAVLLHLREHVQELVTRDPGVRLDLPDALHKARVATRRLRSALKTFRPLLDRAVTDPLREELAYVAGVLGAARDAEVLRARLRAGAAELPGELVVGPVARRVDDDLHARHRLAHDRVVEELDGARYRALLAALTQLVDAPPWTDRAARPADRELRRLLKRVWARLDATAAHAAQAPTAELRDQRLHEVRKAAKQMRYAAEATAPALGKRAKKLAAQVEGVQEALGEHQDSVVARQQLRELGMRAHLSGENGFTFGLLHGLESARARRAETAYQRRWRRLSRPAVTGWLH